MRLVGSDQKDIIVAHEVKVKDQDGVLMITSQSIAEMF